MVKILKSKLFITFILLFVLAMIAAVQLRGLSIEITTKFDGKRWSLPAVVYARPLELYPGLVLTPEAFEYELQLSGYREEENVAAAGGYNREGSTFELVTRSFVFPSGREESRSLIVVIYENQISQITDRSTTSEIAFVRLDPARIGSFHPLVHEDRIVVQQDEIPPILQQALLAVEDKRFFEHHGISITGIARAMLANIKAGRTVQGGSTLTQQLVKNFFLNRDRTLSRKIQEALMAILLEYHYSKEEIMTAYINEVFLGQDGSRAIHGFALASQFYFRRDLRDLSTAQVATLVGMVKGPSLYNPLRKPENCLARRKAILNILLNDQIIDLATHDLATQQPLTDVSPQKNGFNRFPAFLELVRRQLKDEYHEEDLKSSGLRILTTLNPQIQQHAEQQLVHTIDGLEKSESKDEVEGAVVITGRENGEVHAIVGGKEGRRSGFNRALDARRPIGSLIKPAVYLAALRNGYSLATPVSDIQIELENQGRRWKPKNYDNQEHGRVALYTALAKSYNLATVRLGIDVGIEKVAETLELFGVQIPAKLYPSLLLGSMNMSPLEVAQFYQTIGSGGFYLPARSIQAVLASDGSLLTRYGLKVEQRFSPQTIFLLNHGLMRVMEEGTGKSYNFKRQISLAGKTGTTNGLRDSWFAGYSGANLVVVWLGNDDNKSIALSGSSGALQVWGNIMQAMATTSLKMVEPEGIMWRRIDTRTLRSATLFNRNSTVLPFAKGAEKDKGWRVPSMDMQAIENKAQEVFDSFSEYIK